jgi:hypothetical protein
MPVLGFLHTSPVHIAPFEVLLADLAPGWTALHVVDESLLNDARSRGEVDAEIVSRLTGRLAELQAANPDAVICTCSTLGSAAEQLGSLRVDRPMAAEAVRLASIGVGSMLIVATTASTIGPTKALIDDELHKTASRTQIAAISEGLECATVHVLVLEEAWSFFERGDMTGYSNYISEAIRAHISDSSGVPGIAPGVPDVIVLAQASMRDVPALLTGLGVPVLTSLALAVQAATSR